MLAALRFFALVFSLAFSAGIAASEKINLDLLIHDQSEVNTVTKSHGSRETAAFPNDPRVKDQQWLRSIGATETWENGSLEVVGGQEGRIVSMDSGVQCDHEDIFGACNGPHKSFAPDNFRADEDPSTSSYSLGHGTFVAGVMAAICNNDLGIASIACRVDLTSYRIMWPFTFDKVNGYTTLTTDIEAIVQAYESLSEISGKFVVNNSFIYGMESDKRVNEAVNRLQDNALFATAAGNNSLKQSLAPCNTPAPNVICVGSTGFYPTLGEVLSSFSNFGPWVHIAAPGEDILTTGSGGKYARAGGTSLAAPMVSGIAAVIWQKYPELSPEQVKRAILDGATFNPRLSGLLEAPRQANLPGALEVARKLSEGIEVSLPPEPKILGVRNYAGGQDLVAWSELEVYGENFSENTEVWLNGDRLTSIFISSDRLNVRLPMEDWMLWQARNTLTTLNRSKSVEWSSSYIADLKEVATLPTLKPDLPTQKNEDGSYTVFMAGLGKTFPIVKYGKVGNGEGVVAKVQCLVDFHKVDCKATASSVYPGIYEVRMSEPVVPSPQTAIAWQSAIVLVGDSDVPYVAPLPR